jgi:electron-transferring-flavoprotein dehydrogenase
VTLTRPFSGEALDPLDEPRECMPFDVLIVGGGPAGLAAAIRLKQLSLEKQKDLSVCVIDKGSEIGAHILSGNVFDPKAMHELFPDQADPSSDTHWTKELEATQNSVATPVTDDEFLVLTETGSTKIPNFLLPPQLDNHGNYIVSLSQICRWMAGKAEELGVEIYPGFAASEVLVDQETNAVKGIATRDVGIAKNGTHKPTFERGVELHARQTLLAEGARGSCSEYVMEAFDLRRDCQPQTYGLGLKEVWQVPPESFQKGLVQHTLGYPLQSGPLDKNFGGSFLYHQEPDLVLIGLVVGLDYANPYLNPYQEFQRWKSHPDIRKHLDGGTCVSYGARVLNEGGWHAVPKLSFPGGALLGCGAGFLNAVKIKGSHTAIKSGILAAEAAFDALKDGDSVAEIGELPETGPIELTTYETAVRSSWIKDELYQVRNTHEAFSRWGVGGGLIYTGLTTHVLKGQEPWTLKHLTKDCEKTEAAANHKPIEYPAPDGKLTFDLLTNLQRAGTFHEDDQPSHLRIKPEQAEIPKKTSLQVYAGPEQRFCPAAVYEYVDVVNTKGKELVINAQNCIHCKCCSIKTPKEYIRWSVPEGGGGPQYQIM